MSDGIIQGYRLSPQQKRLWSLQQHTSGSVFWSRCAVRVKGPCSADRLERAIRQVIEKHEILRTTFPLLPGMTLPVQVIHEDSSGFVKHHDLTSLSPEKQHEWIHARRAADLPSNYDT